VGRVRFQLWKASGWSQATATLGESRATGAMSVAAAVWNRPAETSGRDQVGCRQATQRPYPSPPPQEPRPQATPGSLCATPVLASSYAPCGRLHSPIRTVARGVPLSLPSPISSNRLSHNLCGLGTGDGRASGIMPTPSPCVCVAAKAQRPDPRRRAARFQGARLRCRGRPAGPTIRA
jgi:hypothetical protein